MSAFACGKRPFVQLRRGRPQTAISAHRIRLIASIGGQVSTMPPSTDQASSSVGTPPFVNIPIPTKVPFSARPDQSISACESELVIGSSSIDFPNNMVGHSPQPQRATTFNSLASTVRPCNCGSKWFSNASSISLRSRLSGIQYGKPSFFMKIVTNLERSEPVCRLPYSYKLAWSSGRFRREPTFRSSSVQLRPYFQGVA